MVAVYRRKWVIHIERITREKASDRMSQMSKLCRHRTRWRMHALLVCSILSTVSAPVSLC